MILTKKTLLDELMGLTKEILKNPFLNISFEHVSYISYVDSINYFMSAMQKDLLIVTVANMLEVASLNKKIRELNCSLSLIERLQDFTEKELSLHLDLYDLYLLYTNITRLEKNSNFDNLSEEQKEYLNFCSDEEVAC